jgi:hypothetical protein
MVRVGVALASLVVLATACWLEVWNPRGDAAVRWRIEEYSDPARCAAHQAEKAFVRILDAHGKGAAVVTAPCASFLVTAAVDPGWYTAEVTLRDAEGAPVSVTSKTSPFYVPYHGRASAVADFASNAFGGVLAERR